MKIRKFNENVEHKYCVHITRDYKLEMDAKKYNV